MIPPVDFPLVTLASLALALALSPACAKEIQDPRSDRVDFADPKSVTASIFYAAESGRTDHLRALCDPAGENDEDTGRICAMTAASPDWADFRAQFARAHLNGEPRVSGDRAALHFVFGPDATRSETMELVRRDGRWYLSAF
jgi:hypothetical protein